jgi:hypothetical protein
VSDEARQLQVLGCGGRYWLRQVQTFAGRCEHVNTLAVYGFWQTAELSCLCFSCVSTALGATMALGEQVR